MVRVTLMIQPSHERPYPEPIGSSWLFRSAPDDQSDANDELYRAALQAWAPRLSHRLGDCRDKRVASSFPQFPAASDTSEPRFLKSSVATLAPS